MVGRAHLFENLSQLSSVIIPRGCPMPLVPSTWRSSELCDQLARQCHYIPRKNVSGMISNNFAVHRNIGDDQRTAHRACFSRGE